MQLDDAIALRAQWGDKPCDHPSVEKEYSIGGFSGEHVCSQCGKEFTTAERQLIESQRENPI